MYSGQSEHRFQIIANGRQNSTLFHAKPLCDFAIAAEYCVLRPMTDSLPTLADRVLLMRKRMDSPRRASVYLLPQRFAPGECPQSQICVAIASSARELLDAQAEA